MSVKSVAFGPHDTYVVCWSDDTISWSGGQHGNSFYNLLNGRYNNSGQENSPAAHIAVGIDGRYAVVFADGDWRIHGDNEFASALKHAGSVRCLTFGPDVSYILIASTGVSWRSIPKRAEELIKTKNNASLEWAALGHGGAYFLLFDDGACYWCSVHPKLDGLLHKDCRGEGAGIKRVFLSPFDGSFLMQLTDGRRFWDVNADFDSHMGVERQRAPGKKRKTTAWLRMRPSQIRFSHQEIGPVFTNGKRSIKDTFLALYNNETTAEELPLMYVVPHGGHYVTISNRRLAVFRLLEIYVEGFVVPVEVVQKMGSFPSRNNTQCNGEYAYLRHTDFYIGRTAEETNFDPFSNKLSKPPIMCQCCDSDNESDIE